ncbi:MAG: VOC family protein [Hyphomicrobiales bacterium]
MNEKAISLASQVDVFGIILGTERYDACVAFYRDILGLPVWYEKPGLLCLRFGTGYLMIETGGMARDARKPNSENPTMLRFNVKDVAAAAADLEGKGISVKLAEYDWGTVGTFTDPDGNACELKDSEDPFFQ